MDIEETTRPADDHIASTDTTEPADFSKLSREELINTASDLAKRLDDQGSKAGKAA